MAGTSTRPQTPTLRRTEAMVFDRAALNTEDSSENLTAGLQDLSIVGGDIHAGSQDESGVNSPAASSSPVVEVEEVKDTSTSSLDLPLTPRKADIAPSPRQPKKLEKKAKKARYYANALSEVDKQALVMGEENGNVKKWTAEDLMAFHESRLDLVPQGIDGQEEIMDQLQMEKEKSENAFPNPKKGSRVSRFFQRIPAITVTPSLPAPMLNPRANQTVQTLPGQHLRSSSAPAPYKAAHPVGSRLSLALPTTPASPADSRASSPAPHLPIRAASTGEYTGGPLTRPPPPVSRSTGAIRRARPSTARPSTSPLSPLSPRSSLSVEAGTFQPRPDITFDTFLAPHKSGKGEAFAGTDNAWKDKAEREKAKKEKEVVEEAAGTSKPKLGRRLSKMPSLSSLRGRKSHDSDIPQMPPLPKE